MKNILSITQYSLLTVFFLCALPLCAQEKTLDRMTRSEVKQRILQHMQIKDHVTFYHSNDKDIYAAYDLVNSGDKKEMLQGKTILLVLHDLAKALTISDKLIVMESGAICFQGTPDECVQKNVLNKVFHTSLKTFSDAEGTYYFFE